jgi:hypothetical protein
MATFFIVRLGGDEKRKRKREKERREWRWFGPRESGDEIWCDGFATSHLLPGH